MNSEAFLRAWFDAICSAVAIAFAAAPMMWTAFFVAIIGLCFAAHEILERRGWRAAAGGLACAIGIALTLAFSR